MTGKVSIKALWHSPRKNHRHLVQSSLYVVYTGPEIYFTAELNAGVQYISLKIVRWQLGPELCLNECFPIIQGY